MPDGPVDRWSNAAGDVSPRRAELHRLADAGRLVIDRMATTDIDIDTTVLVFEH